MRLIIDTNILLAIVPKKSSESIEFPKVNALKLDEFKEYLINIGIN